MCKRRIPLHKPAKRKAGRPRIDLTPEQIAEIPTLAAVLTQEQMADYFGISERTARTRFHESPEILAAYKKGRAAGVRGVAGNLVMRALKGDTTAAIFFLKTQAGWKETTVTETRDVSKLTDEELAAERKKLGLP